MAWSSEETRNQARLMGREIFNPNETETWTVEELANALEARKAARWSGLDRYPLSFSATWETLKAGLEENGVLDVYESLSYEQQGLVLLAAKIGYDAGSQAGRHMRDE